MQKDIVFRLLFFKVEVQSWRLKPILGPTPILTLTLLLSQILILIPTFDFSILLKLESGRKSGEVGGNRIFAYP